MSLLFAFDRRAALPLHPTSAFSNSPSGFRRLNRVTAVTLSRDGQVRRKRRVSFGSVCCESMARIIAVRCEKCTSGGSADGFHVCVVCCSCKMFSRLYTVDHKQNSFTLERAAWCFTLYPLQLSASELQSARVTNTFIPTIAFPGHK
jgi:hypothetical protein